jgi:hypothetical protein
MRDRWITTLAVAIVVGMPAAAPAQQPADAAVETQAPAAGVGESVVGRIRRIADEWQLVERLDGSVDGWYPRFGGMTTGSGFALGPGYRARLFGDRVFTDVSAALSHRGYKAVDVKAEWLNARYDRLELWTNLRYQDFPQEDFFGFGGRSRREMRTNYAIESADVGVLGIVRMRRWMRVGADWGVLQPNLGPGTDERFPSTERVFTEADAPGLTAQSRFRHTTLFAEVDYRDVRGSPRRGGHYKTAFGIWDDRSVTRFDFRRFDAEVAQFLPIAARRHVIAARAAVAFVYGVSGGRVPFYFVPYVGGSNTVRSHEEFRFRDENAFWLNAEYRWTALDRLDVAVFSDAGQVDRHRDRIAVRRMKTGYGIGVRVHARSRVIARLDVGLGGHEGRQVFFKLSESF